MIKKQILHFVCLFLLFAGIAYGESFDPVTVYLTLEQPADQSITIHWITKKDPKAHTLQVKKAEKSGWTSVESSSAPLPQGNPHRHFRAELTNLTPLTDYTFRFEEKGVEYRFRTLPATLQNGSVSFAVGGDCYHDSLELLEKTNRQVAKLNPLFVLIGGDIAYAAKKYSLIPEDGKRWLDWLIAWKKTMVTTEGRLIPFVTAIGNHDVTGGHGQSPDQAPYYYQLFTPSENEGYHAVDIGNYLTILSLDSGHTHPVSGKQTAWLKETLLARQQLPHKFAFYHVPAYPSYRKFSHLHSKRIRKYWVPLFEQFQLSCAFEHHDHTFKRTPPILKGAPNPHGVLYMGDGAWGVKKPRTPKSPKKTWYLEKTASTVHFIFVTLYPKKRIFEAIDSRGVVFDHYEQILIKQAI